MKLEAGRRTFPLTSLAVGVFLTLVSANAAWAACDGTRLDGGPRTIRVGTAMRTFVVQAPSDYGGRTPAPVVFAFHPFGTSAQYMAGRAPMSRAWPDAIAVYPNGMPRDSTNLGLAWQGRPGDLEDRDLRFFDAMVAWLVTRACIDEKRLFVLGYSNGAALTYLLACERSARIAGVAIAAGRLGCTPSQAKPVAISHGTVDQTIGYGQAVEAAQKWATSNKCKAPPAAAGIAGCMAAEACASSPLMMCTHSGGHEYDPSFTERAVDFFKSVAGNDRTIADTFHFADCQKLVCTPN